MKSNAFKQIVVFGAGAVGSWLGARLQPTALLVTRADHARAINASGLSISGLENDIVPMTAVETCPDLEADALLLVTVKAQDLVEAARAVRDHLREDTVVAVLSNGLDPDTILGKALGRPVIRVITQFGVTLDAPGRVSSWGGRLLMGAGDVEDRVADCLAACGLPMQRSGDLLKLSWEKLAMNCVANPLSALTGRRNHELVAPELKPLRHAIVAEVTRLAAVDGVDLDDGLAERIDDALSKSNNITSMLQDLRRGRRTEIDYLNGLVADRSARLGLDAPCCAAVAGIIRLKTDQTSGD
jgi:2-dehydropantoate 2-reductase